MGYREMKFNSRYCRHHCCVLLLIVCISYSCSHYEYTGSGEFVGKTASEASVDWYVDLGEIDLTQESSKVYPLGSLPSDECTIALVGQTLYRKDSAGPQLELVLLDDRSGSEVLSEAGKLTDWTWASSMFGDIDQGAPFIFVRGPIQPGEGATPDFQPAGKKVLRGPHQVWGTSFVPVRNTSYSIRLTITQPSKDGRCRLIVKALGWK